MEDESILAGLVVYRDLFNKTKSKKLGSLSLCVSEFQRNYAWDAKHLKEFIDSIEQNDKGFYIGNILIQSSKTGTSGDDLIVDGQQRLITLSLILVVLNKIVKFDSKTLLFSKEDGSSRIKFFRENLQLVYEKLIKAHSPIEDEIIDKANIKLIKSINIIQEKIKDIKNKKVFLEKILSLNIVIIKCPSKYDVNSLFEGLNSKGKPLSAVELTKNSLLGFSRKTAKNPVEYDEVIKIWEKMEKAYETKGVNGIWFDKFFRHRSFLKYGYVSNSAMFSKIKSTMSTVMDILNFSKELEVDSHIYLSLRRADLKISEMAKMERTAFPKLQILLVSIKTLGIEQAYSVIFSLLKYGLKSCYYFERDYFLRDVYKIFSFLVLIKFSPISPARLENPFATFCKEIESCSKKEFNARRRKLFFSFNKIIPENKDVFIKEFCSRINCTGINEKKEKDVKLESERSFLKVILLIVSKGKDYILDDCTIEHIIPKTNKWRETWPYVDKSFNDNLRFKIGNLALLKDDALGCGGFINKINVYKKSEFSITKQLNNKKYRDGFLSIDPTEVINVRGSEIASELYDKLRGVLN